MHEIISVIPARGGSISVYNKNIRDLCGQPVIAYSILDSLRTKEIQETFISTDSSEIADISLKYGAEVPFLRPEEYAKKDSPDIEWALHFLDWYKERYNNYPKYIVHLRPTTPFRKLEKIKEAIELIKSKPEATSLVSVEEFPEVYKSFRIPKDSSYLEPLFDLRYHLMPRQAFETTYLPNGYVDILKTEVLLNREFHGDKILAFPVEHVPEIDEERDLIEARIYGERYLNL